MSAILSRYNVRLNAFFDSDEEAIEFAKDKVRKMFRFRSNIFLVCMGCYHSCWLRCVNNWEAYKVYFNRVPPPPPPPSEDRNYVNKFNISLFDFLQWNSEFSLNIRFLFPLNVEFGVSSFFFFCRILNLPSVKSVHHRMLAQPLNILQKYKKNLGILY